MKKIKQSKKIIFFSSGRADLGILLNIADSLKIKNLDINFLIVFDNKDHLLKIKRLLKEKNYKTYFVKGNKRVINDSDIIFNFTKIVKFTSKKIEKIRPKFLIILGDRFEALAAANSSNLSCTPIIHFHGGELTANSHDDYFRHSITKLSTFHFVSHSVYRKRVIQMGENPNNVFNIGAPALISIKNDLLKKKIIEKKLKIKIRKNFFIFTYHPETLIKSNISNKLNNLFKALKAILDENTTILVTKPGNDLNSLNIESKIIKFCKNNLNAHYVPNLGNHIYHSCLNISSGVIGNSSSGIIEAPSFNIKTINIGDRQKGRIHPKSVISLNYNYKVLINKINSLKIKKDKEKFSNPFHKKRCSDLINKNIKRIMNLDPGLEKKKFYDLI